MYVGMKLRRKESPVGEEHVQLRQEIVQYCGHELMQPEGAI